MENTFLILPNQLFENTNAIEKLLISTIKNKKKLKVVLYEHPTYFTEYAYHKLKLIMHKSSMLFYYNYLTEKFSDTSIVFKYVKFNESLDLSGNVTMYDPVDFSVDNWLEKQKKKFKINLVILNTPMFLCSNEDLMEYLDNDHNKDNNHIKNKLFQTNFYIYQRKRLNILMENDKPMGGEWTYDTENRKPFTKETIDELIKSENKWKNKLKTNKSNHYIQKATKYVFKHFKNNPGLNENEFDYYLPITHQDSKKHFNKFLKNKLKHFGAYQDAVHDKVIFGFHSIISPMLNTGLLTPEYVVKKTLKFYEKEINNDLLSSVEGFIRQIIGWREIVRLCYKINHATMVKENFFNNNKKLPSYWFNYDNFKQINKKTSTPINDLLEKVFKYGYAHHIERLMFLSNYMLLLEINPKDVFNWFMCLFIDSYNWVMEPNVYAMGQFSSGPILMTRPYFSSSNYIIKMSSGAYKKQNNQKNENNNQNPTWYEIWDILYYKFINKHQKYLAKNYAIASAVAHWKNKSNSEKEKIKNFIVKY